MRVAFLGNSYTYFNELPTVLATLAALTPARIKLHHASVTPGGSSLADHATRSKASGAATAAMLAEAPGWDYVVLQDQSQTPGGGMDGDSGVRHTGLEPRGYKSCLQGSNPELADFAREHRGPTHTP